MSEPQLVNNLKSEIENLNLQVHELKKERDKYKKIIDENLSHNKHARVTTIITYDNEDNP